MKNQQKKKNKKNFKARELINKYSFVFIILGAALVHLIIKKVELDYSLERAIIFILWVVSGFVSLILFSKETEAQKDFRLSKSDLSAFFYKPGKDRMFLESNGIISCAIVNSATKTSVGGSAPSTYNYVVKYSFEVNGSNFTNKTRYFEGVIQNIPNIGDYIEIKYDAANPNNSIIVHEPADKVSWYKLQKKYKIKIINS
jgi:hypothetical protein